MKNIYFYIRICFSVIYTNLGSMIKWEIHVFELINFEQIRKKEKANFYRKHVSFFWLFVDFKCLIVTAKYCLVDFDISTSFRAWLMKHQSVNQKCIMNWICIVKQSLINIFKSFCLCTTKCYRNRRLFGHDIPFPI